MLFKIALFGLLAAALPIEERQFGIGGSDESDDLSNGLCADVVLIYARASTEAGNMGSSLGPSLCTDLKSSVNAICQGVGGPYTADIGSNLLPQGTSPAAIAEATRLFNLANTQCPNAKIVAGGYSQGTAVMAGSISALPSNVMSKVVGTVLFGYTRNAQNAGGIPNYPTQDVKVYCNADDGVCGGALAVTAGHFAYTADVQPGAQFLAQQAGGI